MNSFQDLSNFAERSGLKNRLPPAEPETAATQNDNILHGVCTPNKNTTHIIIKYWPRDNVDF